MQDSVTHVTIAGSTGLVWLTVVSHFAGGLVALAGGLIALVVAKGGRAHKRAGMAFTWGMIYLGLTAAGIYVYRDGKLASAVGGIFVVYLVFTATTTVKPLPRAARQVDIGLMALAFLMGALLLYHGTVVWAAPGRTMNGAPAGMVFFLGTVCTLAAIGDARMIHAGGITGPKRLARHLWRMCFGFFIATGSFFLGQMKFLPEPLRILPLLLVVAVAPLFVLLYWMWRIRLRKKLSGMIIGNTPIRPSTNP